MRAIWIAAAASLCAVEAGAGAWPREPGGGFVSYGVEVTTTRRALDGRDADPSPDFTGYQSLFAEFGVTPRFTAGLDLGGDETLLSGLANDEAEAAARGGGLSQEQIEAADATDRAVRTWSAIVFGRYALSAPDARHRFAVQLGLGLRSYEEQGAFFGDEEMREEFILRPLLAYGRGFAGERLSGWLSVEGSVELRARTSGEVLKLDTTLGLRRAESRLAYLLQVFTGRFPDADPFVKLQPGLVTRLGRGVSLETGAVFGVEGDDSVGATIGLWFEW